MHISQNNLQKPPIYNNRETDICNNKEASKGLVNIAQKDSEFIL